MLLNNLCEVFNSKLIIGRNKPIITYLEYLREYLMKRIVNVGKVIDKSWGLFTTTSTKLLGKNIDNVVEYNVRFNGSNKYHEQGPSHNQHVVDTQWVCNCRKWELIGIPCKHVIITLNDMEDNGENIGNMSLYVDKVYCLETWKKMCIRN